MAAPHSSLEAAKQQARLRALSARRHQDPGLGARLVPHVLSTLPLPVGAVVSGFWPMKGEIDIRPLLLTLHERGHDIVLPVTPSLGEPLRFRRWAPGIAMVLERFGTLCPSPEAAEAIPNILFVPLVAFDRTGRRLGYGGGYYDRTLAALPGATAIGCAFAAQELDEVPAAEYDMRLSAVATERGVILCESP